LCEKNYKRPLVKRHLDPSLQGWRPRRPYSTSLGKQT